MASTELLTAETAPRDHRLRVVEGPDAGRVWAVRRSVVIGTSEHCDLRLEDPAVSRRHAQLEPAPDGLAIADLESRNGVRIGPVRVTGAVLPAGQRVALGRTVLEVELDDGPWEEPTPAPEGVAEGFGRFLGGSTALEPLYRTLVRAAGSDVTVLLEGESGTGKELLAEALHERSPRASGPFVVVDFAAMPESLIESTLFGHERGAFTGAEARRRGAFEEAHGGTIFLDEIGELPLALQTRLLGVLERRRFTRVGSAEAIEVDVRVVAATNRNLEREVEQGRFRLDLFHRLAIALVRVPPLRRRPDDVERLARHFVRASLQGAPPERPVLTAEVVDRMRRHPWPGNVRELRNYVERLVLFGAEAQLLSGGGGPRAPSRAATAPGATAPLVEAAREGLDAGWPYRQARAQVVDAFTELYVAEMLARHDGDVAKAAEAAQVARRHFNRLRAKR